MDLVWKEEGENAGMPDEAGDFDDVGIDGDEMLEVVDDADGFVRFVAVCGGDGKLTKLG